MQQHARIKNSSQKEKKKRGVTQTPKEKIQFERTARNSPHQNGKVERAFQTLYGRVRSCNNHAEFTRMYRDGLWGECTRHCIMMDVILMKDNEDCPYVKFYNKEPKYANKMKIFGGVGKCVNLCI